MQHKLHWSYIFNIQLKNVSDFLKARGNPYLPENHPKLHNNGGRDYELFRNEKFVDKSCKLSDTICLSSHLHQSQKRRSSTLMRSLKNYYVQKSIDIARGSLAHSRAWSYDNIHTFWWGHCIKVTEVFVSSRVGEAVWSHLPRLQFRQYTYCWLHVYGSTTAYHWDVSKICFKRPGGNSKVYVNISRLLLYLTAILRNLLK